MRVLHISGGATKFVGLMAAARQLIQIRGFRPDVICGTSSGSLVAILSAMHYFNAGVNMGRNLKLSDIFSSSPITSRGTLSLMALWRVIIGMIFPYTYNFLGKMGALEKNIRRIITTEVFSEYQRNRAACTVYVVAVNASDKSRMAWNLKTVNYETMVRAIMASCSMPVVAPAVKIDSCYYYDGGMRDHSPGAWFCDNAPERFDVTEMVSIYSRPEDYQLGHSDKWRKNVATLVSDFVLATFNVEISKNDEAVERAFALAMSAKYTAIFIDTFVQNLFDVTPERLEKGISNGIAAVNRYYLKPQPVQIK